MSPSLEQLIQDKSLVYLHGPSTKLPKGTLPRDPEGLLNKRILLRRGGALGDVLFVAGVASTIRSRQKKCTIDLACPDWIMPLVRRVAEVDRVLSSKEACKQNVWEKYDFLVDFGGVLERDERTKVMDYFKLHTEHAGVERWPLVMPTFNYPKGSQNYLAIHVGGSNEKKKWPIVYWEAMLAALDRRKIAYVLLGDGGDDHPRCLDVACDLIGSTDIDDACKIVSGAALFVGTDSGLLHFAGMAGVPTFSLWGAFDPKLTLPNYKNARFVQSNLVCSPCSTLHAEDCKHAFKCMSGLKPENVFTKLWNHPKVHKAFKSGHKIIGVPPPSATIRAVVEESLFYAGESVKAFSEDASEVSILIPHKNTLRFLPRLFSTIVANTEDVAYETVLCTDGDKPYLRSGGKEVVLKRSVGYAGANNRAYAKASQSSEFICLLNADIEVEPNWLSPLITFLKENPEAGIVGSKQMKFNGKIESLGSRWEWSSMHFPHIGYGKLEHPEQDKVCEREMITFSAILIRRSVWDAVGGIDEAYAVGYWEDSHFCMKARQLGWKIFCVPQSVVKHHVGGSKAFIRGGRAHTKRLFKEQWVDTGLVDKFRAQMGIRPHKEKIVACYIVLNEEEFIQASLASIYDFADEIIIVEGGNDFAVKAGWCGKDKRSSDRTVERIKSFPDPDKKITLLQGSWKTKTDQRNAYASRLNSGDWMLLMDGDEVFLDKGLWRMSALMHHYDILMPGFYLFWNNFHTLGTSVWNDFLQTKAVKWRRGFKYINHNCPSDASGKLIVRNGQYKKWRSSAEKLYCHYSWVKPLDKLRAKAEYYRHQGGHPPVVGDYIDRVFLAWRDDPQTVERRFGTHPYGAGETEMYKLEHPASIARLLAAGKFNWK